jgi:hypothetical protein
VESVYELEAQRNQKRHSEQKEWIDGSSSNCRQIVSQMDSRVMKPTKSATPNIATPIFPGLRASFSWTAPAAVAADAIMKPRSASLTGDCYNGMNIS